MVDDTNDIRELLRVQLEILGYHVVVACDGQEALEVAKRERPALILMDLSMPVLDGLEATRQMRETAEVCDAVIVACTALGSGQGRAQAIAAGCNDFIRKPVGLEQLSNLFNQHLQQSIH